MPSAFKPMIANIHCLDKSSYHSSCPYVHFESNEKYQAYTMFPSLVLNSVKNSCKNFPEWHLLFFSFQLFVRISNCYSFCCRFIVFICFSGRLYDSFIAYKIFLFHPISLNWPTAFRLVFSTVEESFVLLVV